MNINTKEYWDGRFVGDWENKSGRQQTINFATTQVNYFNISSDFSGKILDFGCGLGDALSVYSKVYPHAKLFGQDISEEAIKKCENKYGKLGQFIVGDFSKTPIVDIIIASNVFEHLSDHIEIAKQLLEKCTELYIIVPYREVLVKDGEHINSYSEDTFKAIGDYTYTVFPSKGWSQQGLDLWINVYFKNIIRPLVGKKIVSRHKQIMFHFKKT